MNLQQYLDRVHYDGRVAPDLNTLAALHKAHVCSVPFENLDVQLGRHVSIRIEDAFQKIVSSNRGGWCYEQNGLFGWALSEIGFGVTRIAASVMRQERGAASTANHLCLLVRPADSATQYLADVGFGGKLIKPLVLQQADYQQVPFSLGIERLDENDWRFWEDTENGRFSYDFAAQAACEAALETKSSALQSDPESNFVLNLAVQLRSPNEHYALRGRVFSVSTQGATTSTTIATRQEWLAIFSKQFGLEIPEIAALWPKVVARHAELFE